MPVIDRIPLPYSMLRSNTSLHELRASGFRVLIFSQFEPKLKRSLFTLMFILVWHSTDSDSNETRQSKNETLYCCYSSAISRTVSG